MKFLNLLANVITITSFSVAVHGRTFLRSNCVRVDVEGEVTINAVRGNETEFSFKVDLSKAPFIVSGNCSQGDTSRAMSVHFNQTDRAVEWTLVFVMKDGRALMDQLIRFTPSSLFRNGSLPSELVLLADIGSTALSLTNSSFVCKARQRIPFESADRGGYNFTVSQVIRNLHVQAFNLKGKTFDPAEECSADHSTTVTKPTSRPTTEPGTTESTTLPTPTENVYIVHNKYNNVTCIVLRGDINFTNIVYNLTGGGQATAESISIPRMNETVDNVKVSGTCGTVNSTEQLNITFNRNWNLTLTFARGSEETSSMLKTGQDEFSLRDIQFDYVLTPEFFPNASDKNARQTAWALNLTGFMAGSVNGGSYKCNSKVSTALDNGVHLETTNLQYKAFNFNNDTSFNKTGVSECPADSPSDSLVPIIIGVVLAVLVVGLVLAYIIGSRRKRGYQALE